MENTDVVIICIAIPLAIVGWVWWYYGIYENTLGESRNAKISIAVVFVYALFPVITIITGSIWWIACEAIVPFLLLAVMVVARRKGVVEASCRKLRLLTENDRGDPYVDPPRPIKNGSQPFLG